MLRFLFVTMACLALASCKTAGEAPAENKTGDAEGGIYYKSQAAADTALAAFDKDNPSCQLWTNWQKMCSRTGENEATYCATSKANPVKPSKVFCAAEYNEPFSGLVEADDDVKIASFLRFCQLPEGFEGSVADKMEECKWSRSRPFSGRSLVDLQHPWCKKWSKTEASDPGNRHYYCSKREAPDWCVSVNGFGYGAQEGQKKSLPVGIYVTLNRDYQPFSGIYCMRKVD